MRITFFLVIYLLGLSSVVQVNAQSDQSKMNIKTDAKAEKIIDKAIEAHGGDRYETANFEFVFRKKKYTFKNDGDLFSYSVTSEKNGAQHVIVLDNYGLRQTVNNKAITLSEKENKSYTGSLNSVIYFATLPHKLKDKAVIKHYIETTTINDKSYEVVAITFKEEGGGEDHDDTFYYWINKENNIIDFLAYNYSVNNGGVRFRTAYNARNVDGILFQDYVNYKAEVGTPLVDLPVLWEKGELKELSKIETEKVKNLSEH